MVTAYRHRTPREKAASESARIAVARAEAHAGKAQQEPASAPVEPVMPAVTSLEPTSAAAAWRDRCRQIREEIDAERARRETA